MEILISICDQEVNKVKKYSEISIKMKENNNIIIFKNNVIFKFLFLPSLFSKYE